MKFDNAFVRVSVDPKSVVQSASIALATLAPELPESVPGHCLLLHDMDVRVQARAARDLGLAGSAAASAAVELTSALEADVLVAREAATALGMIGVDEDPVLAALVSARWSVDGQLASRAADALRQLAAVRH